MASFEKPNAGRVRFPCVNCNKSLKAKREEAGKVFPCPFCGRHQKVPLGLEPAEADGEKTRGSQSPQTIRLDRDTQVALWQATAEMENRSGRREGSKNLSRQWDRGKRWAVVFCLLILAGLAGFFIPFERLARLWRGSSAHEYTLEKLTRSLVESVGAMQGQNTTLQQMKLEFSSDQSMAWAKVGYSTNVTGTEKCIVFYTRFVRQTISMPKGQTVSVWNLESVGIPEQVVCADEVAKTANSSVAQPAAETVSEEGDGRAQVADGSAWKRYTWVPVTEPRAVQIMNGKVL